jgi:hypothetical protein
MLVLFVVSFIFSFIAYWEKHIADLTKDNVVKMHIRGALHAFLGALIGVVAYAMLIEFQNDLNFILKISLSIFAAVLSDSILLKSRKSVEDFDGK